MVWSSAFFLWSRKGAIPMEEAATAQARRWRVEPSILFDIICLAKRKRKRDEFKCKDCRGYYCYYCSHPYAETFSG